MSGKAASASAGLFRVLLLQSKGAMMTAEKVAMLQVREIMRLKVSRGLSSQTDKQHKFRTRPPSNPAQSGVITPSTVLES